MIKKGKNFTDIYNYRNSSYFIKAVEEARKNNMRDDLVILQVHVKVTMKE